MKVIGFKGGKQTVKIHGSSGATFDIKIKNEDGLTYDFENNLFNSDDTILKKQKIGNTGVYNLKFIVPAVSDDDTYDIILTPMGRTIKGKNLAKEETTLKLHQYSGGKEFLFDAESGGTVFTLASALTTGVKVIGTAKKEGKYTWSNTGTIVKGTDIIYATKTALEWDGAAGTGDFTNVFEIEKTVDGDGVGTKFRLNNTTNLASGMYLTGEGIRGEDVTISSISSGVIVLSSSQNLAHDAKLTFTNGRWGHESIKGVVTNSGTNSLTLTTSGVINRVGVANITSMIDVDDFISRDPNAFALKMKVARGAEATLNLSTPQTDTDAGDWTYKCSALPASGHGTITQTNSDAVSAGDTFTSKQLSYAAPSGLADVGTTKTFIYKTSTAGGRNSSTTTGVVSIEITSSENTSLELNI